MSHPPAHHHLSAQVSYPAFSDIPQSHLPAYYHHSYTTLCGSDKTAMTDCTDSQLPPAHNASDDPSVLLPLDPFSHSPSTSLLKQANDCHLQPQGKFPDTPLPSAAISRIHVPHTLLSPHIRSHDHHLPSAPYRTASQNSYVLHIMLPKAASSDHPSAPLREDFPAMRLHGYPHVPEFVLSL